MSEKAKHEDLFAVPPVGFKKWRDRFYDMTEKEARLVRKLRVEKNKTWEEIAIDISFDGSFGHISGKHERVAGMMLCEKAAEIHGEHYLKKPWYNLTEALK